MNLERDKFLTKAMGLCWHETNFSKSGLIPCVKCNKLRHVWHLSKSIYQEISFDSWQGFGILWEWAIKQDWWEYFLKNKLHIGESINYEWDYYFDTSKINPNKFADTVYEFLKGVTNDNL